MDRTVVLRPLVASTIKIWRLTMFKRRKSDVVLRDQQTLNNNVTNYEYNCLKLHPWTNIVTMVVWARAKLISMFYATVIHRLWPRCCLSRRAIGPLKQHNAYFFSFERVVWVIRTIKRCQSTAGIISRSPPTWCVHRWIHKLCSDPPYHSLLESWARWKMTHFASKKGNYLGNYSIYEHRVWWVVW